MRSWLPTICPLSLISVGNAPNPTSDRLRVKSPELDNRNPRVICVRDPGLFGFKAPKKVRVPTMSSKLLMAVAWPNWSSAGVLMTLI